MLLVTFWTFFMVTSCHFFDHASTTPCCPEALEQLIRFNQKDYGNPSSTHALGRTAQQAVEQARTFFAEAFQLTSPHQILFTSGGTEADNLAIQGVALHRWTRLSKKGALQSESVQICISATEHPAVLNAARSLQDFGFEVSTLPVQKDGQLAPEAFEQTLRTRKPFLVSIHQVNSITGALLPVEKLAQTAKNIYPDLIFHTDSVQGFGKAPHSCAPSAIDLVSISAHKIGGPKGIGALIILNPSLLRSGLRPLIHGGNQELGLRSGTQSPALIAAFARAAERRLSSFQAHQKKIQTLRHAFQEALLKRSLFSHTLQWNSPELSVPHIISLSAPGHSPTHLSRLLEDEGYFISTRSACSSKKIEPEPVLQAMGFSVEQAASAFRISFSDSNSLSEVEGLAHALETSLQRLRALSER